MKKYFYLIVFAALLGGTATSCRNASTLVGVQDRPPVQSEELLETIKAIPEVKEVNLMGTSDHFIEYYEIWFEQHVDPNDENSPTFKQRVLLGHVSDKSPVIVELQGYEIYTPRSGELASMFKGNQITIEHRFFDESRPEGEIPWKYLTVENAAVDQHRVIEALKKAIYPNSKFVSTGISKGGQTTMLHRTFYPNDVDASVCYVAPLNFEREDPRIYHFLDTVGTEVQRDQVEDFQNLCFDRKDSLVFLLDELASSKDYSWNVTTEKAMELYVLEYSFAFWQWGGAGFDQIPDENATCDSLLNHVLGVSGVSFFENAGVEKLRPFFWAALTQMGMYGYKYEAFKEHLSEQQDYYFDFTFPEGYRKEFDPTAMKKVNDFIQQDAHRMMFIYGGKDTWSATAVQLGDDAKNRGLKKHVFAGGHHWTRIRHFEEEERKHIIKTLESWIVTSDQ